MNVVDTMEVGEEDRLSSLPTNVFHHILSFLTMEDIAKLSLVSKKCEIMCLTAPSLGINSDLTLRGGSDNRLQFMDFLVSFMKRRKGAKITDLFICWSAFDFAYKETNRIMWLLKGAVECQVNMLVLHLNCDGVVFIMPMDIICAESLTCLTLALSGRQLEFPSPYGFSHIKHLHLGLAEIATDSLGEWISTVCKFLEELRLSRISGMKRFKMSSQSLLVLHVMSCDLHFIDISTQSLKTLTLNNPFDPSSSPVLNIQAPNLLTVSCSGICFDYLGVEESKLGLSVDLTLPEPCPNKIDELKSLLLSIGQVTELLIDCLSVQELYENTCLPFELRDLQSLVLRHYHLKDTTIPGTVQFLLGLPHCLRKLRMFHGFCMNNVMPLDSNETSRYDLKFWESHNFKFVREVEELDIHFSGGKSEEGLVEYLLGNAKRMKKLRISYKGSIPTKLAHKIDELGASSTHKAEFSSRGNNVVVLKFKPKLRKQKN